MKGSLFFSPRLGSLLAILVLTGCASSTRAPVEDRAPAAKRPVAETPAAPAVARPGYYIVKKGDTLFSLALENGQDWRDIAAWNGLDNPNLIRIGQELRVKPEAAASAATATAVVPPTLESKPLESRSLPPASAASSPAIAIAPADASLRREPRGGKVAYSDQALAAAIKGEEPVGTVPAPAASKPVEAAPKPEASAPAAAASEAPEGDWMWPAAGKIVGSFSESGSKGVDIAGQLGDPVVAAGDGKVVYVGAGLRGYGNLVIIKHDATYLSAYAHNQKILVKEGQSVRKGQQIAQLGESDADRPKVHFEIRRQGKPVDPVKYLPKR
ncbi:peptidoglycan DD-metalloendopeptidase family protein [Niveibacterium sp. SC-1]|uniref:peptidoglycan DD-metalloendopeptidase family protein n=1 Tax=Niveibacterium sp. SC-1 TaxID=3135646 RepID=UPI00311F37F4